jgi:hypothetical protein
MKKLISFLLAAVMVISLAACSGGTGNGGNSTTAPSEGWAAEYTILVGGSDEWTPFSGKSGVTFANSDKKVLEISDNGAKVEFTGLVVGESVITATLDGAESKALVRVRAVETTGKDLLKWRLPKSLYVKWLPGDSSTGIPIESHWIGDAYEYIYTTSEPETIIQYGSQAAAMVYSLDESDPPEYQWSDPGQGWGDDILGDKHLFGWRSVIPTRIGGMEKNHGGIVFRPLNDFAFAVFADKNFFIEELDISKFRTGRHEPVLGIDCDIFEVPEDIVISGEVFISKGTTYYVDPATHYTLKTVWADGSVDEVLEYDVNYSGGVPYAPGGEPKLP